MTDYYQANNIHKIAIIDDDLSDELTFRDLERAAGESLLADVLKDVSDPDNQALIAVVNEYNLPTATPKDLSAALSLQHIREKAPDDLKNLAQRALDDRVSRAEPVLKIKAWIIESGFNDGDIHLFASPEAIRASKEKFDIVLVDYLLVDDSEVETIKLVRELLEQYATEEQPLLFILMSSYQTKLKSQFFKLREDLKATSSRFRILKKPANEGIDKAEWLHTLNQLCIERSLVPVIESFINEWGEKFTSAVDDLSSGLWALDAHSIDILRRTAKQDNAYFPEYFAEVIVRRVLAEVEQNMYPIEVSESLEDMLKQSSDTALLGPGTEVDDSREALRRLLGDIGWHRENWFNPIPYPNNNTDRFSWVLRYIRFGTVLKNKNGALFVHLTQPCDIAHLNYDEAEEHHLLLFPGKLNLVDSKEGSKEALSSIFQLDDSWHNIHWSLNQPVTPSIKGFLTIINDTELKIVGQLRHDQAQQIIAKYLAKVGRVATLRVPTFTKMEGIVLTLEESEGSLIWNNGNQSSFSAHLLTYQADGEAKPLIKNIVNFLTDDAVKLFDELEHQWKQDTPLDRDQCLNNLLNGVSLDTTTLGRFLGSKKVKDFRVLPKPITFSTGSSSDNLDSIGDFPGKDNKYKNKSFIFMWKV